MRDELSPFERYLFRESLIFSFFSFFIILFCFSNESLARDNRVFLNVLLLLLLFFFSLVFPYVILYSTETLRREPLRTLIKFISVVYLV